MAIIYAGHTRFANLQFLQHLQNNKYITLRYFISVFYENFQSGLEITPYDNVGSPVAFKTWSQKYFHLIRVADGKTVPVQTTHFLPVLTAAFQESAQLSLSHRERSKLTLNLNE